MLVVTESMDMGWGCGGVRIVDKHRAFVNYFVGPFPRSLDSESVGPAPTPRSHHWGRAYAKAYPRKSQCASTHVARSYNMI